ncbi:hypothetical protein [Pleurocapsa sp. CCALA 161]|uniref:hypothetical protein n=1 Tax=Pleurocapsa sp. CCALA 161 TaxID=2107688 RepID=UPI0011B21E9F|nr:hypothetical protein [Pleurocapsa sp. CCALA 161]
MTVCFKQILWVESYIVHNSGVQRLLKIRRLQTKQSLTTFRRQPQVQLFQGKERLTLSLIFSIQTNIYSL